jgi:murein DD-endopeptidase MepM/ murein hydrolase activator NlpD
VSRGYEAPASEFGPGHRGIDLKATTGERVLAIRDGIVDFVGQVALTPTVSVVHEGGWRSSYQPVVSGLHVGQQVNAGQTIGAVGVPTEHCSCLHLGLKYQGLYLSPLTVLGSIPRAVLLPW